jgi:pimeloyl-ACP methyl ester carboxylesterase
MSESPRWFRDAIATPAEDCGITLDGCPIHYLRWGQEGLPGLVFVHGGAAHAHWWSFIAPLFTREYRVAAIDLSGHGDSGRRDAYPRDLWAREVLAVAEDAGFAGPPIVVGHSMGGFVAISAAVEYGEKLAGAVILDSPVRLPDHEDTEGARKSFRNPKVYPDADAAMDHFRTVPDQPSSRPWILDYVGRKSLRPVEGGVTWKFDPRVFRRETPRATRELLPRVKIRVALFRAENGLVTPDIGEFMYELMGRVAPVIEIPEAYHHMMLDQPLLLVTGLRTLLADWEHSVPRRRGP